MNETALREAFTNWNVYQKVENKLVEAVKTTERPMTLPEALEHFDAIAVSPILD